MPKPITIVSGLPRSGTSLMMQMLVAGGLPALTDNLREPDEDNPRGYFEFEPVKAVRENQDWLSGAGGKVVKMVYRLLYDLPDGYQYRVVFMRRDLDEVVASQEEMLRRNGKASDDVDPAQLAQIYRRQLQDVTAWLSERPNFRVLDIHYQEVLREPERVVAELNEFLGGHLNTAAMLEVPDQTLYRQRR